MPTSAAVQLPLLQWSGSAPSKMHAAPGKGPDGYYQKYKWIANQSAAPLTVQ